MFPNAKQFLVHISGTIHFTKSFYSVDVLFIPNFHFNRISAIKLVASLDCKLKFQPTGCLIQDMNTMGMIGSAEIRVSLYRLIVPVEHIF